MTTRPCGAPRSRLWAALRSDAEVAVPDLIDAVKSAASIFRSRPSLRSAGSAPTRRRPSRPSSMRCRTRATTWRSATAQPRRWDCWVSRRGMPSCRCSPRWTSPDVGLRYQAAVALQAIDPNVEVSPLALAGSEEETRRQVAELLAAAKREDSGAQWASIGPAAIPAIPEIVDALVAAPSEQRAELASLLRSISRDGLAEVPGLIETCSPANRRPAHAHAPTTAWADQRRRQDRRGGADRGAAGGAERAARERGRRQSGYRLCACGGDESCPYAKEPPQPRVPWWRRPRTTNLAQVEREAKIGAAGSCGRRSWRKREPAVPVAGPTGRTLYGWTRR